MKNKRDIQKTSKELRKHNRTKRKIESLELLEIILDRYKDKDIGPTLTALRLKFNFQNLNFSKNISSRKKVYYHSSFPIQVLAKFQENFEYHFEF